PRTGCSPASARCSKTTWTTVHGLYDSTSLSIGTSWSLPRIRSPGDPSGCLILRHRLRLTALLSKGRRHRGWGRADPNSPARASGGPVDELTPTPEDSRRAATARRNFLTLDPVEPQDVRPPILASWVRSRRWNLPA